MQLGGTGKSVAVTEVKMEGQPADRKMNSSSSSQLGYLGDPNDYSEIMLLGQFPDNFDVTDACSWMNQDDACYSDFPQKRFDNDGPRFDGEAKRFDEGQGQQMLFNADNRLDTRLDNRSGYSGNYTAPMPGQMQGQQGQQGQQVAQLTGQAPQALQMPPSQQNQQIQQMPQTTQQGLGMTSTVQKNTSTATPSSNVNPNMMQSQSMAPMAQTLNQNQILNQNLTQNLNQNQNQVNHSQQIPPSSIAQQQQQQQQPQKIQDIILSSSQYNQQLHEMHLHHLEQISHTTNSSDYYNRPLEGPRSVLPIDSMNHETGMP